MRDPLPKLLKPACIVLAALFAMQIGRIVMRSNPLSGVEIPAVPTLTNSTNAAEPDPSVRAMRPSITNNTPGAVSNVMNSPQAGSTNPALATNVATATGISNQLAPTFLAPTNQLPATIATVPSSSNAAVQPDTMPGLAVVAHSSTNAAVSNSPPTTTRASSNTPAIAMASQSRPSIRPAATRPPPELPLDVRARIDRVYESELLAPIIRPMPAALMGIAGQHAMLRSSSGQSALVKEGDSVGDMKLVRIGINRVLVEEKGEQKELMIFEGFGGESLKKTTQDETVRK